MPLRLHDEEWCDSTERSANRVLKGADRWEVLFLRAPLGDSVAELAPAGPGDRCRRLCRVWSRGPDETCLLLGLVADGRCGRLWGTPA